MAGRRNYPLMTRGLTIVTRIVGALFFGYLGLRSAAELANGEHGLVRVLFWTVTPVGFTLFGALVTPLVLLPLLGKFQEWTKGIQPTQLVLGTLGLLAGLLVGALLSPALFTLPGIGGLIAPFVVSVSLGVLGVAIMLGREEEFASFVDRFLPGPGKAAYGREIVVDTSAIIDGRIADIAGAGFLQGTLVVPRFILDELRYIADSPDSLRRNRGRRGLEVLAKIGRAHV